jgi:predicted transcriptional regulator
MEKQNITLSIPKEILRKIKIIAAKENSSVSTLLTNALEELVELDEGYRSASQEHSQLLQQGLNLGTKGSIDWSREELHAR